LLAISDRPPITSFQRDNKTPHGAWPCVLSVRLSPVWRRNFDRLSTDPPTRCAFILALLFQQRLQPRPCLFVHVLRQIPPCFGDLRRKMTLLKLVSRMDPPHPHRFRIRFDPREGGMAQDLWRRHPLNGPGKPTSRQVELERRGVKIRIKGVES